jgi:hypothetical protein
VKYDCKAVRLAVIFNSTPASLGMTISKEGNSSVSATWVQDNIGVTPFSNGSISRKNKNCGHNILEPVLVWPSKTESKTRILVEPLEPRLYVSLKWKKHACGSGGVSIII